MEFALRLAQLIEEKGITQRALSHSLNLAASTVNGYINDYREPDLSTLIQIAGYFHVTTDYLLGISEIPGRQLSAAENKLLAHYRCLSKEKQELLIEQAKMYYRVENRK